MPFLPILPHLPHLHPPPRAVLSDNNHGYTCFSVDVICLENHFPHFHSECVFAFAAYMYLLKEAYGWVLFLMQSTTICLFIGKFNPFIFKVIIDV